MKGRLALMLIFIIAAMGCKKSKNVFDVMPNLDSDKVTISPDSLQNDSDPDNYFTIKISFTDGDGDIGSSDYPPTYPLTIITYPDSTITPQSIPDITPDGNNKAISGTIEFRMPAFFLPPPLSPKSIHFAIYLKDRAGHISNTVITPTVVVYP